MAWSTYRSTVARAAVRALMTWAVDRRAARFLILVNGQPRQVTQQRTCQAQMSTTAAPRSAPGTGPCVRPVRAGERVHLHQREDDDERDGPRDGDGQETAE
jgi:hypothetical protein